MSRGNIMLALLLAGAGFAAGIAYMQWKQPTPLAHHSAPRRERRVLYYVDPMHPAYKSDKPGVAPDCGMRLEPVYADQAEAAAQAGPIGSIQIPLEKQQLIGVRYGTAEYTSTGTPLRAVGTIAADETLVAHVHTRVDGWIERVHAAFTGAYVHKGDPLLTIYSPDMLATEKEYLLALKARTILPGENSNALVDASRQRLQLWDLTNTQIEQIERTREPIHSITVYSPAQGYVSSRNAFPNQRITPETELYNIADLSRVWIMADVFEADLPKLRVGQTATISMPGSTATFRSRVSFIQPQVDPLTRTLKLRLEAANPGERLKPGMFVDVDFHLGVGQQLTVPSDAVLDSGERQLVFVDRGNGYIEPRPVQVGDRSGDRTVILNGLSAGERIVTAANFLVDSEAQLRAAVGVMSAGASHDQHHH